MPLDAAVLLFLIFFTPLAALVVCLLWVWVKLRRRAKLPPTGPILFVERRWIILPSFLFLGLYLLCFLWGLLVEPYWIEVTRVEIPVKRPVLGHDRFRIVHLSDLHIEGETSREHRMLRAVREAKPHLILLTGDYLNSGKETATLLAVLEALDAPYGVFGVPGNWDRKFPVRDQFRIAAERRGRDAPWPRLLEDDYQLIREGPHKLLLLGQGVHPHRSLDRLLEGASEDAFRIFLHHMPDAVEQITALPPGRRVDLFLCGHTHGGQVRLPFWGAILTLSRFHKRYEAGLYRVGDTPMYLTRGIGVEGGLAPRVRFLCRPEVTVIELVAETDGEPPAD